MSVITIGGIGFGKRYKTLEDAFAGNSPIMGNDTVRILKHRQLLAHGVQVKTSLFFEGKGQTKTILTVAHGKSGFVLQQGDVSFSNLTIEVGAQTNALRLAAGYTGTVTLDHVTIRHLPRVAARELYQSVIADPVRTDDGIGANGGTVVLDHAVIDSMSLPVTRFSAVDSQLGQLMQGVSSVQSKELSIKGSTLEGLALTNWGSNSAQLLADTSRGGLIVRGAFDVGGLSFSAPIWRSRQVKKASAIPARLAEVKWPKQLPFLSAQGRKDAPTTVDLHDLAFDLPTIKALPKELPMYWFNFQDASVAIGQNRIPAVPAELTNLAIGGNLTMSEVKDKSDWQVKDVTLSNRSSESVVFGTSPDANGGSQDSKGYGALQELDALTGLGSVKKQVHQLIDTAKVTMESARRSGNPKKMKLSMHMVFAGSAGTGKTTVARLVGKALYENGVLKTNKFKEIGGGDLTSNHVGESTMVVQAVIRGGFNPRSKQTEVPALDGVLFIDEAYSLTPQEGTSFNDEAVSELIRLMDNYRDRLVVVMAGYTPNMKHFFKVGNPGLQSRFANWIEFPDYTPQEMSRILIYQLTHVRHLLLEDRNTLAVFNQGIVKLASHQNVATGNGRFIRNLLDQAVMAQASRLSKAPLSSQSDKALKTLTTSDAEKAVQAMQAKATALT